MTNGNLKYTNLILKKIQGKENTNQWISFYMITASVMLRKYLRKSSTE